MNPGPRTLAVCCPQWPTVAAGRPVGVPAVVLRANRVVDANPAATAVGVVPGLRRREAQARCPSVEVVDHDPERDARTFESVMVALEDVAPRWEVTVPGRCVVAALGPSRYHGGDRALAERVHRVVTDTMTSACGAAAEGVAVGVAVADGPGAARLVAALAAAGDTRRRAVVIPPGAGAGHLDRIPVRALCEHAVVCPDGAAAEPGELEEFTTLLTQLGVRTLGALGALDGPDVLARFGRLGAAARQVARGEERLPPVPRAVRAELSVEVELDPPADRIDRVAFAATTLAEELQEGLAAAGLSCDRVLVVVDTEGGERIERLWRAEGALGAAAVAQRTRWQVEGWLLRHGPGDARRGGVCRLRLEPDGVAAATGTQQGFWGGRDDAAERVRASVDRLRGVLGVGAVQVPEWKGGRAPGERLRLVPLDGVDPDARHLCGSEPWPGHLPPPSPTIVHSDPAPVVVVDDGGSTVGVGGRGLLSAPPRRCQLPGSGWAEVVSWGGPWCVEERWWDPFRHRRRARLQVVLHGELPSAHLLVLEDGRWRLEASWD